MNARVARGNPTAAQPTPSPDTFLTMSERAPSDHPAGVPPPGAGPAGGESSRVAVHAEPRAGIHDRLLLEVSWEVCHQVGGIYQVLRSKIPAMMRRWDQAYVLLGPYIESRAVLEFEPTAPEGLLARAIAELRDEGLVVHHGRWLVAGHPRVLLVEHAGVRHALDAVKYRLWEHHGIESPGHDWLINDAVMFGEAVRRIVEKIAHLAQDGAHAGPRRVIAHFHEWLGSLALPMLRHDRVPVALVFTTHATVLGRCIAPGDERFYDLLPHLDPWTEAARFNARTAHAMERACAHAAHVFTTVSAITAEECTHLLDRTPDVVTPNGLNVGQYYLAHEMQFRHAEYKERIHDFVMGHFFPSYAFDLDRTLYFFTAGRFEPRNKGFDLCLEAMSRLNAELLAAGSDLTVVFFIITNRPCRSINPLVLEKRGVLNELRGVCRRITDELGHRLYRQAAAGERIHLDDQVDEYWALRYRRTQYALRWAGLPLIVTHILDDDRNDPVLNHLRYLNLINRQEDRVKVVYHPEFISAVSPLWGIEYDQFVRGCHLGIFPSLYEPWGYTPLECMALGVPAVTSDLAGFGRWASEHLLGHEELGLLLVHRRGRGFHASAAELTAKLLEFCRLRRRDRIALRNTVERTAWEFDWSRLIGAYHRAHDLALARFEADCAARLPSN